MIFFSQWFSEAEYEDNSVGAFKHRTINQEYVKTKKICRNFYMAEFLCHKKEDSGSILFRKGKWFNMYTTVDMYDIAFFAILSTSL